MATVTKPMALDESIKTTESTSRNIADVLAQELSGIASAITGGSDKANKTDIATVESGSTASRAYSVGELVYVNGNLYKVITAIASGATFTVGTNIQSTNVSGTVKDALEGKVDRSGDTMSGNLTIDKQDGTISTEGFSYVILGNDKAIGTDKNSTGMLDLFGDTGNRVRLYALSPTAIRYIGLPDASGTLALTSNIVAQDFNTTKSIGAKSSDVFTISNFTKAGYTLGSIVFETSHTGIFVAYTGLSGSTGYFSIFNSTDVARTDEPIRLHVLWVKS